MHVGSGIGMGLVLGGQLLRGAHGVAGEIAYMPLSGGAGADEHEARKRGTLESAASASGVVRAARHGGMGRPASARRVFAAAASGDERAMGVVAEEARLIAKTICAVITVVDPDLIVLGGGSASRRLRRAGHQGARADRRLCRPLGSAPWAPTRWSTAAWRPAPSSPGAG